MKVPVIQHRGADVIPSISLSTQARRAEMPSVREVIAKETGYPLELVTPESHLAEDLGLDFFDVAEIVAGLETRFSVRISDRVLDSVTTVADIERFLGAHPHRGEGPARD